MPFKSKAQRLKFYEEMKKGNVSAETIAEWEKDTPKDLPEHVGKKVGKKVKKSKVIK